MSNQRASAHSNRAALPGEQLKLLKNNGPTLGAIAAVLLLAAGLASVLIAKTSHAPPIRLGLLQSRTGAMMISEKSMIDAEMMAVDEINARGGLLGRKIEVSIAPARSDWPTSPKKAEPLIIAQKSLPLISSSTSP